ncbi:NADPH-dependent glutamate synthase beta subunit-like oxidoreductase [Desulfofundulus luciae]|uniref:NADPH-dependent glutamate synthase beta subunit-like oxidoreductase n=1 Tax=Desulfofundulus luciae TaxID=74702 RepID=A0ABU0B4B9_9FIRM|nr:FAD-dependent oxidoreductase [Desulfofundulus luciae]MDQ0287125.1 NADPH-dependent glutamate synthase beta subunit-like oxidoreductase [Desulfofundulus luciae]
MAKVTCSVKKAEEIVKSYLDFYRLCGQCRSNLNTALNLLGRIRSGKARLGDLEGLLTLVNRLHLTCHCGQGKRVAPEVMNILREDRDDFIVHIENRVCPASECPQLVLAPCQAACPAGIDIPNYVALVGQGKYTEALQLILEDVPLPGVLGRICEHPCERACRRGEVDAPISICALKRLAYDQVREIREKINLFSLRPVRKSDKKVAVVGSGPAGLSCAYFLAKRGYAVTIFEAMPEPGGMLAYGIPPYRLPREVLRDEISRIQAMGVEIRLNSPITGEYGIEALMKDGYAAVFLGTGAWKGSIPIPNHECFKGVMDGVTFLRTVNQSLLTGTGEPEVEVRGKRVVVVGGGNVAIDAARVARRLGAREVRIIYRRTRREMPALDEEIEAAEREGVILGYLISPTGLGGQDRRLQYIECIRNTLSEPDATGRCWPVPIKNSEFKMEADIVIFAVGQKPDLSFINEGRESPDVLVSRDRIVVNPDTMETSRPGVFAGGDVVTGPASAIKAVAAGKRAAAAIDAYLRGEKPSAAIKYPVKRKIAALMQVTAQEKSHSRVYSFEEQYLPAKQHTFEEVMEGLGPEAGAVEAGRCLRCDLCIACGKCVDTCRKVGAEAIQLGYVEGSRGTATDFARPGDKCIGCGSCSVNCPTGAITINDEGGFREMRMGGTLMSRLELFTCRICGQPYATSKHLDFVNERLKDCPSRLHSTTDICPDCLRRVWAHQICGREFHPVDWTELVSMGLEQEALETEKDTVEIFWTSREEREVMERIRPQMQKIHALVSELSTVVHGPGRLSLEAGRILKMITDVAEQVNLLALNASIEAVRIGGQGNEFSALLNEVHELAAQSTRVATEIGVFTHRVRQEISSGAGGENDAGDGSFAAGEGVLLTVETRKHFNDIVQHVENVIRQVGRVARIAGELSARQEETVLVEEKSA